MKIKTISIGDLIRIKARKRGGYRSSDGGKVGIVMDKHPNAAWGQVEYRVKVPGKHEMGFVREDIERAVAK